LLASSYEVAIVGPGFAEVQQQLNNHYLPDVLLSGGPDEGTLTLLENKWVPGQTTIYVCPDRAPANTRPPIQPRPCSSFRPGMTCCAKRRLATRAPAAGR